MLHVPTGTYFGLDAVAADIVDRCRTGGTGAAVSGLVAVHGAPVDRAEADVRAVLEQLRSAVAERTNRSRRISWIGARAVAGSWRRLSLRHRRSAVGCGLLLLGVEGLLHVVDLRRVARLVGAQLSDGTGGGPPWPVASASRVERRRLESLDWLLRRWTWDPTCLRRALAMAFLLRARRPQLCLGVLPSGEVHAWLVLEGHTLNAVPSAAAAPVLT